MDIVSMFVGWFRPLVVIAVWVVLAALFVNATLYLWKRSFGEQTASVNIKNDKGEDRSARFIARTTELVRPLDLDRLYEVNVPRLSSGLAQDLPPLPAGTKLEVKGVDVWAAFRLVDEALRRDLPRIEGTVSEAGGTVELMITDRHGTLQRIVTVRVPLAEQANPRRMELILDEAIYHSLYHLNYGNGSPKGRDNTMSSKLDFGSPEALEAYFAGRWHLEAYQSLHDPAELDRAEAHLSALRQVMPKFTDGLLLLGITLTELRKEEEAISVFTQLEADLASSADTADQRRLFQAKLYGATALRKRYTVDDNSAAVAKLNMLVNDLESRRTAQLPDDLRTDFLRFELSGLTELVSAVGHYQVLLDLDGFIRDLRDADPIVRLNPDELKQAELKDANTRVKLFAAIRERLLGVHEQLKQKAYSRLQELGGRVEQSQWPSERVRYLSRLRNAHGYTVYRHAQFIANLDRFKSYCELAIKELRQAEADDPQNYAILQNLAVALLDPRNDPGGKYVEEAKRLLERSLLFKPRDYYGYQLLAQAIVRKADLWGADVMAADEAAKAVTSAEKARSLRPFSKSILPVLVSAYSLKWELSTPTDKGGIEAQIQTVVGSAKRQQAPRLPLAEAQLRWLTARLRSSTSNEAFNVARDQLVMGLAEFSAALLEGPTGWQRDDMQRRRDAFDRTLKGATFDRRKEIAWPP